jgi:hypothetical protein
MDVEAENARLLAVLQNIVEAYEVRYELYNSDEECAVCLRDKAAAALNGWDARWPLEEQRAWMEGRRYFDAR